MNLTPYRVALAVPGLRSLLLTAVLARIPHASAGIALTFYVLLDLDRGYAAAGLVGAAVTIGAALGAPLLGRLVDRRGLPLVLVITTAGEALFWTTAPQLPYGLLLPAAFLAGLLALPLASVIRQCIAALVPPEKRRPAYALDSMSTELSYMIGPALGVALTTAIAPRIALWTVGGGIVAAGVALLVLNPPVRTAEEESAGPPRRIPRRQWLTGRLVAVLAVSATCTLVLAGTDVAVVAALRDGGQVAWTGVVVALWALASLVGGFAFGALSRPVSPLVLIAGLAVATMPVGLAGGQWWVLSLALIPAGMLCAPTLTATSDAVSHLAPAPVRGEAMGLQASALTVGAAIGAPLTGAIIDRTTPTWGFAAIGLIGVVIALVVLPAELRHRQPTADSAKTAELVGSSH